MLPKKGVARCIACSAEAFDAKFERSLKRFDHEAYPTGRMFERHRNTLHILCSKGLAGVLVENADDYWRSLNDTLVAWGMNRGGWTRLRGLDEYRASVLNYRKELLELDGLQITDLQGSGCLGEVTTKLQRLVSSICVGVSEKSKVVPNTKVLHHLLPALVPPIDRRHTLRLFFGDADPPSGYVECFQDVFPHLARIAARHSELIHEHVARESWHTSISKVLDNAIWGYWLCG